MSIFLTLHQGVLECNITKNIMQRQLQSFALRQESLVLLFLDGYDAFYNSTPTPFKSQSLYCRVNDLVFKALNCFVLCLYGEGFKFLRLEYGPIYRAEKFHH